MKTTPVPQELQILRWSVHGCGVFGILFPLFGTFVLKKDPAVVSSAGFALVAFAGVQLTYITRLQKKLIG
jgi:hypothetical protein